MAMRLRKALFLILTALTLAGGGACAPRVPPSAFPPGVTLKPGRYLTAYYRAPEFAPAALTYSLAPFTVTLAQGVAPQTFQTLLAAELARAWEANGLKAASAEETCRLSGTVHSVSVRGTSFRFLIGKIYANLTVSGVLTRGDQVLFAFQDRLNLTSPVKPGPSAPKEAELLMQQVVRDFVAHLLNEILLQGPEPAEE
jgi:hypothetical protein